MHRKDGIEQTILRTDDNNSNLISLWKNECRKNRSHGIEITGSAAPYLNANQFIENGEHGISVGKAAMPVQVNNTSKGNGRGDSIHYQSN